MKKTLSIISLALGFFMIILSNSGITGSFIGERNISYILYPGIFFFVLGLLATATLEQKAEETPNKSGVLKRTLKKTASAVYNTSTGVVSNVFYGLAAPAASALRKTSTDALKQGLYGLHESTQDYLHNATSANEYRAVTGTKEGIFKRLSPRRNARYVQELSNLTIVRDLLRQATNTNVTTEQAYAHLESLRLNPNVVAQQQYKAIITAADEKKKHDEQLERDKDLMRGLRELQRAPRYRQILETKHREYGQDILGKIIKHHKKSKRK